MFSRRSRLPLLFIATVIALSAADETLAQSEAMVCREQFDVLVMLDRSNDVDPETFSAFKELVKGIVSFFDIKEDGSHFGLMLYNNDAQPRMKLSMVNDQDAIMADLMADMPAREGRRDAKKCLTTMRQQLSKAGFGDRQDVMNKCLLLTTEEEASLTESPQYMMMAKACDDMLIVLRKGGDMAMDMIKSKACPNALL